ncbi:hypothetical protein CLU96_1893 [Chryseobacterium sp. 52]|uniref:hypothetical protein n=1 Tax=Chryseobacterium sp. 52 TaxID=2035213 RepID=UPI000C192FC9|nr:hypothetical protein [Chryseobacterium sp. 52]PIF44897.1 hypothetical protein CLU96_1893 [Chryseobacterium sp. 52]
MTTELIETAANAHAKEVLGEEQFNDPTFETAKDSIIDDFKAGVEWCKEQNGKDLVSFGNYLLSKKRRESLQYDEGVRGIPNLGVVYDADLENWKQSLNH